MDGMTTTLGLPKIASDMESIGRNCEFGFVQRDTGTDPVSLLRWAGTPRASLIDGLRNKFADLAEEMTGRAEPPHRPPEDQYWWLTCKRYGILFHTGEKVAATTAEKATAAIRQRTRWLADKLISDIRDGDKLFVFSDSTMTEPDDALDLLSAMRGIGPAWLWSIAQNKATPPDTMTLGDGMIASWMPHLTEPGNAVDYHPGPWRVGMCVAHSIWQRRYGTSPMERLVA